MTNEDVLKVLEAVRTGRRWIKVDSPLRGERLVLPEDVDEALTRALAVFKAAVEEKAKLDTKIRDLVPLTDEEWALFMFIKGALNEEVKTGG